MLKNLFRRKLQDTEYSAITVALLGSSGASSCVSGHRGRCRLRSFATHQGNWNPDGAGRKTCACLIRGAASIFTPRVRWFASGVGGAAGVVPAPAPELYGISNLDPLHYLAAIGIFVLTSFWPPYCPRDGPCASILCVPFVTIRIFVVGLYSTTHQRSLGSKHWTARSNYLQALRIGRAVSMIYVRVDGELPYCACRTIQEEPQAT